MAVSNAEFQEYKQRFLTANKVQAGFVLMRRLRDNQLSICKKADAESYLDHVEEPFTTPKASPQVEKKKPGPKAKEVAIEGEVDPNSEEA